MQLLALLQLCTWRVPPIPDFSQTKARFMALFEPDAQPHTWRLKADSKKKLFLTFGNIVKLNIPSLGKKRLGAVVNAANSRLSHGGGGTQGAFQSAIDKEVWDVMFHQTFLEDRKRTYIDVSECAAAQIPADAKKAPPAEFIFNVLGPEVSSASKMQQHQIEVFLAYRHMFADGRRYKLRSIQAVLLSVGNFCYLHGADRDHWTLMVETAFAAALIEAWTMYKSQELESVILVDMKKTKNQVAKGEREQTIPLLYFLSIP